MSNIQKSRQLGMPFGTATNRLRKRVLFYLLVKHKENFCFRCGLEIESEENLSIDHKEPWFGLDTKLFWDIGNIAFAHLKCNVATGRKIKGIRKHGTSAAYGGAHAGTRSYRPGCRCDICKDWHKMRIRDQRSRGIVTT